MEKLKVRTGMLLVLFCFVTALALACGLGWINAQRSVAEIEDLNNVAVHQVDPLYEANGALLRTRLALDATISELQSGSADQAAIFLQTANSQCKWRVNAMLGIWPCPRPSADNNWRKRCRPGSANTPPPWMRSIPR